jgi:transposase
MAEGFCQRCRKLQRRVEELEAERQRLLQLLEAQGRAGKRQAAPFSKGPAQKKPKRPGRKAGADYGVKAHRPPPPPEQIDETHDAPLPDACPDCGGPVEETDVQQQYQVEIPRRPIHRCFHVHIGECRDCCRRVQGRHPLQTSDALGAAASQLGADTQAAIVELNKHGGLSMGKVAACLRHLFGIRLTRGGVAHVINRVARRCQPFYQELKDRLPHADWVVPDETGWRVGGCGVWLHGFVSPEATVYAIAPTRSGRVAETLLGRDYAGVMIHDGWSPYDDFPKAEHQQCLAHLLRRCHALVRTATRDAVDFPRRIAELLQTALKARTLHEPVPGNGYQLALLQGRLVRQLVETLQPEQADAANERLAKHLWKHREQLLTFLWLPGIDATNWRAEHAMRFGVILRKVWGGNRTWRGAHAQAVLMSTWRTCLQNGVKPLEFVSWLLRRTPGLAPLAP